MVEDLTGKTFTRLTVIKFAHKKKKFYNNSKKATSVNYWLCKCICGNTLIVEHYHLKYGHTKSCGCLQREKSTKINTKHGFEKSRLYHIWQGMKRRCLNKNEQNFDRYGGRGIKICDKWLKNPKSFILWALSNGYNDNLTLERIDVNGNYSPDNCKWVTIKEQSYNRSNTLKVIYKNQEKSLSEWCELLKLNYKKIYLRLYRNKWSVERDFNTP